MKRKNVYVVLIAGMFLVISIASFSTISLKQSTFSNSRINCQGGSKFATNLGGDRLDQQQTECNNAVLVYGKGKGGGHCRGGYAQSFVPDKHAVTITRIELYVAKIGNPTKDLIVGIGKFKPYGKWEHGDAWSIKEIIDTYVTISSSKISTSYKWLEFDFPDILINKSYVYYILVADRFIRNQDAGCNSTDCYSLGCFRGRSLYYEGELAELIWCAVVGCYYFVPYNDSDLTFKTYAKMENKAPEVKDLYGPTSPKRGETCSYSAVADDSEGDQIYYFFDWGDGTNTGWIGPYPSGKPVSASHTWYGRGDFQIYVKAKDDFGEDDFGNKGESDWYGPLTVHVTKKNKNIMFSWMLTERFPQLKNLILLINKSSLRGGIV